MSKQIIFWAMFILPWLTLFFMKKEDIKRYMPVALLSIVISTVVQDIGVTLGFWVVPRGVILPFTEMPPYFYGTIPIITLWVFKFTYGRFWLYMVTNAILDSGFTSSQLSFLFPEESIGITSFHNWLMSLSVAVMLYLYQMWQEGIFAQEKRNKRTETAMFPWILQSEAVKPLEDSENENHDDK